MTLYTSVFLADDDTEDQEIFVQALHAIDPSILCTSASDGEVALKMLHRTKSPPEIIFLDVNMPRINGKQVLVELKKMKSLANIPVIMYSTFFGERDIDEMRKLGACHLLVKPTEFKKVVESIGLVLSTKW